MPVANPTPVSTWAAVTGVSGLKDDSQMTDRNKKLFKK